MTGVGNISSILMSSSLHSRSLWIELWKIRCLYCKIILSIPCCACAVGPWRGTLEGDFVGMIVH
jgi:hypothetical protein